MRFIKILAYIFVIIGAINWGLVGFFNFDLVSAMFGDMTLLSRIVYGIVGVGGLIYLFTSYRDLGDNY